MAYGGVQHSCRGVTVPEWAHILRGCNAPKALRAMVSFSLPLAFLFLRKLLENAFCIFSDTVLAALQAKSSSSPVCVRKASSAVSR